MKVALIVVVLAGIASAVAAPPVIRYSFDGNANDSDAWRVYDYGGDGQAQGRNIFYPATWQDSGGVNDSGYIWADDRRWRIDTPERPHSILALLVYQKWYRPRPHGLPGTMPRGFGQGTRDGYGGAELDLRNAQVLLYLRGDNMMLFNARAYFWVITPQSYRWHFYGHPLDIAQDHWGRKETFILKNDASQWHNSFHGNDPAPPFSEALNRVIGYGISFVGFTSEVTGKLSMDELEIRLANNGQ